MYIVVKQVLLQLMRKEDIFKTMDAHMKDFLGTDAAFDTLSKTLPTLSLLMVPITSFVRR